jgi:hypothetical protein
LFLNDSRIPTVGQWTRSTIAKTRVVVAASTEGIRLNSEFEEKTKKSANEKKKMELE